MKIHQQIELMSSRPTYMEVNLDVIKNNLRLIREHVKPAKVIAVVKANAYGHGLIEVANALVSAGADKLGVAFLEEAIALRKAAINSPIHVFGGILSDQIESFLENDLEITASSVSKLQSIDKTAAKLGKIAKVQLKIDTGMERIGQHYYTAEKLFEAALLAKNISVAGVFSHLADADSESSTLTELQLNRFNQALRFFNHNSIPTPARHIANSAAIAKYKGSHYEFVRPGLALYGIEPYPGFIKQIPIKAVMELKSKIVFYKIVKAGNGISYSHTYTPKHDTRIVTVPIGYGDGYLRALSNRTNVLIRGNLYPVVGTICMDQMMVDIGPEGEGYGGDEVVIIGRQAGRQITAAELASNAGTIPYEILTSINLRIPRRYIGSMN